ncbi:hypothetical protein [Actinosynnema mirum]|uniref:Phage head morphogenesis protein, SPP1 gp7 family n=1 Tax=Actinosynnema mirum (strain ATCC 29888 / DSM 43827 / JCM 3225 / NBRC 14064 / NCIMB 13271 / NRRL B-12336 / IMRU 3971 / 101) TaxID=446462 RepID=C6W8R9_ACTMD|nr:hypothetical protein [Actinosynnema mirum]ACU37168.1 hypothetical protein Amir_3261 [Actinosynnema mirum DSM 43827]
MTSVATLDAEYYQARQQLVHAAAVQAQDAWRLLDGRDAVDSWSDQVRPRAVAALEQVQQQSAALAPLYVAGALAAARALSAPLGALVASAFAGLSANGMMLESLLDFAFGRYRRALAADVPDTEARQMWLSRLLTYVATETADAARSALHVACVVEPAVTGYVRTVTLPACGRCILLAGRVYRFTTGFPRHPRCDCSMRPVTAGQRHQAAGPRALFDSMSRDQQERVFGRGDAAAIRAGADLGRVVNSRRAGQLYVAGGHEFTREATTTRGVGRQLGALAKSGGRYRRSQVARPTAAQLVDAVDGDREELARQLRRFGYLR